MERLGDNIKMSKPRHKEPTTTYCCLQKEMSYNKYLFILIFKVYLETNLSMFTENLFYICEILYWTYTILVTSHFSRLDSSFSNYK